MSESQKDKLIRETMVEIARKREIHHQPPLSETSLRQAATNIVEAWMREFGLTQETD